MTTTGRSTTAFRVLGLLPVAGCFAAAIWHMRYDWTYDESYRHGWWVPLLALYLFSLRWRDRPSPGTPDGRELIPLWALGAVLLVLVWIVREANPEWRLVGILLSLIATGMAAMYAHNTGGATWMRHFSSPLLFFFAAVPWPAFVERGITETLMPRNAALALEVLHWAGVPAVLRGNLISLPTGTIGIEEACSGIRSLQTTMMIAWFVSDLLHLRWRGRLIVFGAGMVSALLSNAGRTVFLSMTAARSGVSEVESWHDPAALTALGANTVAVLLAGWLVSRRQAPLPAIARQRNPAVAPCLPLRGPLICAAGLAAMIPLTALWYRSGEQETLPLWRLEKPVNSLAFREIPFNDRTRLMLRFNRGWSAAWQTGESCPVHAYFLEWDNGTAPPGDHECTPAWRMPRECRHPARRGTHPS